MDVSIPTYDSLISDLKHPNPNIRNEACVLLAEHYFLQSLPYFLDQLHDEDPVVYRTAVKGLGILGHEVVPELLRLFNETDNSTVRACCIKALVQISVNYPDQAFPDLTMLMLENSLDDPNPVVAQSALMTLGHLSKQDVEQERVIPLLIKACDRSNIAHVQSAAMALAELDSPMVHVCLQKLANDESKDSLIREVAEASLARREGLNFG